MGSDNSNGSAHKHLAQFTLSNAPHGPTFSSCLSVHMLTKPKRAVQKKKKKRKKSPQISAFFSRFPHLTPPLSTQIHLPVFTPTVSPHANVFPSLLLCVSFPSPSPSLHNNLDAFVCLVLTSLPFSLLLSHTPPAHPTSPSGLFLHPLRAAGTGGWWQVAAALCLSACRRLPTCACVCVCET